MSVGLSLLEITHRLPPFITLTDLLLLLVYHTEQGLSCVPVLVSSQAFSRVPGQRAGSYRLSSGVGIVGHMGSSAEALYTLWVGGFMGSSEQLAAPAPVGVTAHSNRCCCSYLWAQYLTCVFICLNHG